MKRCGSNNNMIRLDRGSHIRIVSRRHSQGAYLAQSQLIGLSVSLIRVTRSAGASSNFFPASASMMDLICEVAKV